MPIKMHWRGRDQVSWRGFASPIVAAMSCGGSRARQPMATCNAYCAGPSSPSQRGTHVELEDLLQRVGDHVTVGRAFGPAYEKDETLIIPVAFVAGGGGGGSDDREP